MKKSQGLILSSAALALVVFFLFLQNGSKNQLLRVGINAWPGYEFLYLAQAKGYYRELDLDVKILEFVSLNDLRRAFERGHIDVMPSTMIEQILSRENSERRAQAFLVSDYSDGADVIIARAGLGSIQELKGKKVGYEPGTLGIVLLKFALDRAGMSFDDLTVVSVPHDDTVIHELEIGELDAIVSYPSLSFKILASVPSQTIFSSRDVPGKIIDIISADEKFLASHPKLFEAFRTAYFRAVAYAQTEPEEAYRIMAERQNITIEDFKKALASGIVVLTENHQEAFLRRGGLIDQIAPEIEQALRVTDTIKDKVDLSKMSFPIE